MEKGIVSRVGRRAVAREVVRTGSFRELDAAVWERPGCGGVKRKNIPDI